METATEEDVDRLDCPDRWSALAAEGKDVVERLGGKWRGEGGMCRCPAHDDHEPSLSVRPGSHRLLFHCFAGCKADRVIEALNALGMLGRARPSQRVVAPSARLEGEQRNSAAAARLWASGRPVERSPAQAYLVSRGLDLAVSDLRYHPRTPCGRGPLAVFRPAMLAAVRNCAGLVAVHRTFLQFGAAPHADLQRPKRALGRLGLGAVRLRPPRDGTLGWAEGIETAMAATQLFGIPCWATLGTERFARVALPADVGRLILFLDNDPAGRRAEALARDKHRDRGLRIEARYPRRAGADWNDVLLAQRHA